MFNNGNMNYQNLNNNLDLSLNRNFISGNLNNYINPLNPMGNNNINFTNFGNFQ